MLVLEYSGTRYSGWQIQKNARTVQGELASAVRALSGRSDFELQGSGRTDAGVHALGQVAHLDLETRLPPEALQYAINDNVPADINVLSVRKVSRRFHARHDARARSYIYQISRRRTALFKPYVWWIKDPLDADRMREAAGLFRGMKDFRSFTDRDPGESSTRVLLEGLQLEERGGLVLLRVRGSHFLWKMVRRIVGVLAEIGRGSLRPKDAARFLKETSDEPGRLTAPPSGLFLERVFYEDGVADEPLRSVTPLER
jgi:tRNA pseudouridine38-40 synthase